nr:uncharacterized protein LOC109172327 [Ipomoea batatas]
MVQKRFATGKTSGEFGREKVLDRITGNSDEKVETVEVDRDCRAENEEVVRDCIAENVNVCERERSDVEKISKGFMKLDAEVMEFGDVMAEVCSKQVGKDIVKKTFCKMSDILCTTSSSKPAPQEESLLDDDPIFNDENFLATVAMLEDAFTKTSNAYPISSPNWDLLTPTPNTQPDQEKTLLDKEMLFKYKSYYIARDQFLTLRNGKMQIDPVVPWRTQLSDVTKQKDFDEKLDYELQLASNLDVCDANLVFFPILRQTVQVIDNKTLGKGVTYANKYEQSDILLASFLTSLRAKYAVCSMHINATNKSGEEDSTRECKEDICFKMTLNAHC